MQVLSRKVKRRTCHSVERISETGDDRAAGTPEREDPPGGVPPGMARALSAGAPQDQGRPGAGGRRGRARGLHLRPRPVREAHSGPAASRGGRGGRGGLCPSAGAGQLHAEDPGAGLVSAPAAEGR